MTFSCVWFSRSVTLYLILFVKTQSFSRHFLKRSIVYTDTLKWYLFDFNFSGRPGRDVLVNLFIYSQHVTHYWRSECNVRILKYINLLPHFCKEYFVNFTPCILFFEACSNIVFNIVFGFDLAHFVSLSRSGDRWIHQYRSLRGRGVQPPKGKRGVCSSCVVCRLYWHKGPMIYVF